MTNLDSILKSRDITFQTKAHIVKALNFPVVMYRSESWNIKKAECWRIYSLKLWFWRRLLRVPWTASRSNQSILKEISPEYSLEGLMLKQKLQYFGHLMWRAESLEKTLMLGKIEGRRRRGNRRWDGWMASLTQWTRIWANSRTQWWTGKPCMLQSMQSQWVGHNLAAEQQKQPARQGKDLFKFQGYKATGFHLLTHSRVIKMVMSGGKDWWKLSPCKFGVFLRSVSLRCGQDPLCPHMTALGTGGQENAMQTGTPSCPLCP